MTSIAPFDLASTFVVIGPQHAAVPVTVTPALFEELDRQHEQFKGRLLVSSFAFAADWTTWEMHPAGDEIVCLLTGRATLVLERQGGEEIVRSCEPGCVRDRAQRHVAHRPHRRADADAVRDPGGRHAEPSDRVTGAAATAPAVATARRGPDRPASQPPRAPAPEPFARHVAQAQATPGEMA